jgi:hypothetical protein
MDHSEVRLRLYRPHKLPASHCNMLRTALIHRREMRQLLTVVIAHHEAGGLFFDRPRREAGALCDHLVGAHEQ